MIQYIDLSPKLGHARQIFRDADLDKSGDLSHEELRTALRDLARMLGSLIIFRIYRYFLYVVYIYMRFVVSHQFGR